MKWFCCILVTLFFLSLPSCSRIKPLEQIPEFAMVPVPEDQFPALEDDLDVDSLQKAIGQSLVYLNKLPPDRMFRFGPDEYPVRHVAASLERLSDFLGTKPAMDALKDFIRRHYRVYRSIGREPGGQVLFTGYYEPILDGSRTRDSLHACPVYAVPTDLVTIDLSLFSPKFSGERISGRLDGKTVVPYWDRKEIETFRDFIPKAEVLAWIRDPVDLFFLQVQGSGKIRLSDGSVLNLHYAASNGRPYRSIGTRLIEQGKIPKSEMSMQRIRRYLREHPDEVPEILHYNPSYVFFRIGSDGPVGSIGVPLTPGRSIAVDRKIFPPTALVFVRCHKPVIGPSGEIRYWKSFGRLALSQDTGGAIVGPGRADIFWGSGNYAETAAGHLQHMGDMYFLILKQG